MSEPVEVNRNELYTAMAEELGAEMASGNRDPWSLADEIHDLFRSRGWVLVHRPQD